MELNYRDRVARMTIVYYGPAASGKTTNLQVLHAAAESAHRGDLVSVNSSQGRTILFDMLPLHGLGLSGWEVKFRLLGVPGQQSYTAARRLALRGADAVVFVANSAEDRQQENPESLRDLAEGLTQHHIDPVLIPTVLQYNKQDLPEVMTREEMDRQINPRGVPSLPAVAFRGEGVLETLAKVIELLAEDISTRYRALALPADTSAAKWTEDNILRAFGTLTLAGRGPEAPAPGHGTATTGEQPDQEAREASVGWRVVRVGVPETRPTPAGAGETGAPSPLVGSYAQASVALGQAVEDLREQRDEARRFLEDLQHTLAAVEALAVEHEPETGFRALLARMAASGRCGRASLLTPGPGGTLRTTATLTPEGDVLANLTGGAKIIARHLLRPSLIVLSNPKAPADLKAALKNATPPVHALVSVPLRNVNSFHAVFLLYYGATDPLPNERELNHLDWMGRGLSASLHARRSLAQAREGWTAAKGAVAGEAAVRVLSGIEPLLHQRDGVREVGSAGSPRSLADAAGLVNAVRLLQRGRLEPRNELLDVVLNGLRPAGVEIGGDPGLVVPCEASLMRLALEALVEIVVESGAGPARVTARRVKDNVEISIHGAHVIPAPPRSDTRWLLARRVAELHGGGLEAAARADAPAFTLRLRST